MTATKNIDAKGMWGRVSDLFPGKAVSIAPLITFRIAFGLLMFLSVIRFWYRGWIDSVYVAPKFHFTYMGFEWVHPMGSLGMHVLFFLLGLATICIMCGLFYRVAIVFFFFAFTYVELLDVTTYLNHYYYISLVSFIMMWLPASDSFSLDTSWLGRKRRSHVPSWTINILRFQIGIVYFFAGVAKLNPDWLLDAIPMRIWLPAKSHLPIVGSLMYEEWVAYLFSWFGAIYDLFIVFFLLSKRTRVVAYAFVIIFHVATAIFFPGIGVFPYVMIVSSLIFFSSGFHEKLLSRLPFYNRRKNEVDVPSSPFLSKKAIGVVVGVYVVLQLFIPMRYVLYPGKLFWHEEGFRFSWRVMLMEKAGATYFTVKDKQNGWSSEINNAEFLTPLQEKMMSTQPDLILKYAHFLAATYRARGVNDPEVRAEVFVALNGERSRPFIDTKVDLAREPLSWGHYSWVLPYNQKK